MPTAAKLSELKENQRPAVYNVEASALHFSKPSKVLMSYLLCYVRSLVYLMSCLASVILAY